MIVVTDLDMVMLVLRACDDHGDHWVVVEGGDVEPVTIFAGELHDVLYMATNRLNGPAILATDDQASITERKACEMVRGQCEGQRHIGAIGHYLREEVMGNVAQLMKATGLTRRQVMAAIAEMEHRGCVTRNRSGREIVIVATVAFLQRA